MITRTVLIVQHGEKQQHQADPGLTERGARQADAVAVALRNAVISHVYASPLRRARQTAGPLARALGLVVGVDAGLTERMDWSPSSGSTAEEFRDEWRRASHDRDYQPHSGDSSRRAGQRLDEVLRRCAAAEPDGAVVVVSHGGVTLDFLRTTVDDAVWTPQITDLVGHGLPGGAITEVSMVHGAWRLARLASLDHVPEADRSGHRSA